jgi:hypothetical protein
MDENRTTKPIKNFFKGGNRKGKFDQATLYACMDIFQQNLFVQLICINLKKKNTC